MGTTASEPVTVFDTKKLDDQSRTNVYALMKKDGAKAAYQKFIENGSWKENIDEIQKSSQLGTVDPAATQEALHRYMFPDEEFDIYKMNKQQEDLDIYNPDNDGISLSPEAIKKLSLAAIHPLFLASQEYQEWIDSKLIKEDEDDEEEDTREARLECLFQPSEHTVEDVMETSLASFDQKELDELISDSGDSWVVDVLLAVENLPFCVSIATARESRKGFPLVYVNKAFEKATGYSRNEIVGHNCKFLQGNDFEPEKVKIISDKLRNAEPLKIPVKNTKKDGAPFSNLLALKPVFDHDGTYSYVIGVQYVVSQAPIFNLATDLKLVDDILSILPNVIANDN